ncbi:MAG: hypothetical protein ACHP65_06385 [Legionellales bacterium]
MTEEQIHTFIRSFIASVSELPLQGWGNIKYTQVVGYSDFYEPPDEVVRAMEDAGIQGASSIFPEKAEMRIYENGTICFNKETICTNKDQPHYDMKQPVNEFPCMVIKGLKFKLVKIVPQPQEVFYQSCFNEISGEGYDLVPFHPLDTLKNKRHASASQGQSAQPFYVKIYVTDFLNTEQELRAMDNQTLKSILQDPVKIRQYIKPDTFISYSKEQRLVTDFISIGKLHSEALGDDFYQHTTGVVRVLSAPSSGTAGDAESHLTSVHAKDFIIYYDKAKYTYALTAESLPMQAQFCDADGTILSEKTYVPGDELPSMEPVSEASAAFRLTW